jgi:hypothetical protein
MFHSVLENLVFRISADDMLTAGRGINALAHSMIKSLHNVCKDQRRELGKHIPAPFIGPNQQPEVSDMSFLDGPIFTLPSRTVRAKIELMSLELTVGLAAVARHAHLQFLCARDFSLLYFDCDPSDGGRLMKRDDQRLFAGLAGDPLCPSRSVVLVENMGHGMLLGC